MNLRVILVQGLSQSSQYRSDFNISVAVAKAIPQPYT